MLDSVLCRCEKILRPDVNRSGPNRRHLSTRIQSSVLVVDFRFGSILCSHYSRKRHENLSDMRRFTFKTKAAQHRSGLKNIRNRLFVLNKSPIRYAFGADTRAIRYSVDIAMEVGRKKEATFVSTCSANI